MVQTGTDGPITTITARIAALGTDAARQRLRDGKAGGDNVQRYARLNDESRRLNDESRRLALTLTRIKAEKAEALEAATPGVGQRVLVMDQQAADLEARLVASQQEADAITATVEGARQAAIDAVRIAACGVGTAIGNELQQAHARTLLALQAAISPHLTELVAIETVLRLVAFGGSAQGLDLLVEELAGAATPCQLVGVGEQAK